MRQTSAEMTQNEIKENKAKLNHFSCVLLLKHTFYIFVSEINNGISQHHPRSRSPFISIETTQ